MRTRKLSNFEGIARSKDLPPVSYQTSQSLPPISYQTLALQEGTECALTKVVARRKDPSAQIVPVSNIPSHDATSPGDSSDLPSRRDLSLYRLKNRIAELREREKTLLRKLERCLEVLASEEHFLEKGLHYDQWETYDELMRRKARLRATRDLIIDVNAGGALSESQEKALKEKMRL